MYYILLHGFGTTTGTTDISIKAGCGSNFIFVSTPLNYADAQSFCQSQFKTDLATIAVPSDIINDEVSVIIDSSTPLWFGLFSNQIEGNWLLQNGVICPDEVTGACIDFWGTINNNNNNPLCIDNITGFQCAYYLGESELVFNDLNCSEERPFICQSLNLPIKQPDDIDGSCPCTTIINDTCSDDNSITFTCIEDDIAFDAGDTINTIRSCIDIPSSVIPSNIQITDLIVGVQFPHTWVGEVIAFLQKAQDKLHYLDLPLTIFSVVLKMMWM